MADAGANASGGNNDGQSSGDYSAVIEEAAIGMGGKAGEMATVLSSGERARQDRLARKEAKEKEKDKAK